MADKMRALTLAGLFPALLVLGLALPSGCLSAPNIVRYWPPQLNNYYPELELVSTSGQKVKLSSYVGKVLLIEPIGMSCPACQAFVGAAARGGYNGVQPQSGLPSIDDSLSKAGISPSDPRLVRVQLLLYGPNLEPPTLAQAKDWANHFGFGKRPNEIVLIGDGRYTTTASYNMIPGFQLVDKGFVLRSDATGHNPHDNLYTQLVPMLKKLLNS